MAAVLLLAAPTLRAPDDPGVRGLWGAIALVLLVGLVAAHVRVLRTVARQVTGTDRAAEAVDAATADQQSSSPSLPHPDADADEDPDPDPAPDPSRGPTSNGRGRS